MPSLAAITVKMSQLTETALVLPAAAAAAAAAKVCCHTESLSLLFSRINRRGRAVITQTREHTRSARAANDDDACG